MRTSPISSLPCVAAVLFAITVAGCGPVEDRPPATDVQEPIEEHVYGGLPSDGPVLSRNGYVLSFDPDNRVASWVAYHIQPGYLRTPQRVRDRAAFRPDPDLPEAASPADYVKSGYHRGHLAPYFAMGGDRDHDGFDAASGDKDDLATIYQANRMGNVTPQSPAFNGSGGLWYRLETWVREEWVRKGGRQAWVFAGTVFGPGAYDAIGSTDDIQVPPMFFKILVLDQTAGKDPVILAFLFPHQTVSRKIRDRSFEHFLVSVDLIEAMTGLDFFRDLKNEAAIEKQDTWVNWQALRRTATGPCPPRQDTRTLCPSRS